MMKQFSIVVELSQFTQTRSVQACLIIWTVFTPFITTTLVRESQPTSDPQRILLSVGLFFLFNLPLVLHALDLTKGRTKHLRILAQLAASSVLFVALVSLMAKHVTSAFSLSAVVVLAAAMSEETIFRLALPTTLAGFISGNRDFIVVGRTAYLVSQFVFAVCHVFQPSMELQRFDWIEFFRLVCAGLLYAVIKSSSGLWVAIGVHATVNFDLLYLKQVSPFRTTPAECAVFGLGAFLILGSSKANGYLRSCHEVVGPNFTRRSL